MWRIIKAVLLLGPRIIYSYFAWIARYAKHPEKTPIEKRYGKLRNLIIRVIKKLKMDVIVIGKENIPTTNACYFGNHLAVIDPLPYFQIMDKPIAFLGKIEIKKMPFAGKALAAGDGLFLNRSDLKQELKIMMKVEDRLKEGKESYYIFAEGTRNKDNMAKLLPFHKGTFRAAMKANVPIVPTVNYGSFRILKTHYSFKKYPTIVKILKPIMPEEYLGKSTEEVASIVQSRIQKELSFSIRKLDDELMREQNNKKYRFNQL